MTLAATLRRIIRVGLDELAGAGETSIAPCPRCVGDAYPLTMKPRIAIMLDHTLGLERWREMSAAGNTLDETPYAFDLASDRFDLAWSVSHAESETVRKARGRVAAWLGGDFVHAWRNRRLIWSADAVWTDTERQHLAVALLQRLSLRRRVPVVAQSVWLWDSWPSFGPVRRAWVAWLLRTTAVEVSHSPVSRDVAAREVPGRRVEFVPFGTSAPDSGGRVDAFDVVAVGNDRARDWATLAEALRRTPGIEARVVSSARAARAVDWPDGVEVGPCPTRADLAALYAGAGVIVVPSRDNPYASGMTAAIEAMDACRPMVVSDAGGIGVYVHGAADLVPPGDATALAAAIKAALNGEGSTPPPGARTERGLTARDYVDRYATLTRSLLTTPRLSLRDRLEGRARTAPGHSFEWRADGSEGCSCTWTALDEAEALYERVTDPGVLDYAGHVAHVTQS